MGVNDAYEFPSPPIGGYEQMSIRYRGGNIPSETFRALQTALNPPTGKHYNNQTVCAVLNFSSLHYLLIGTFTVVEHAAQSYDIPYGYDSRGNNINYQPSAPVCI